jgi:hypothetical protein
MESGLITGLRATGAAVMNRQAQSDACPAPRCVSVAVVTKLPAELRARSGKRGMVMGMGMGRQGASSSSSSSSVDVPMLHFPKGGRRSEARWLRVGGFVHERETTCLTCMLAKVVNPPCCLHGYGHLMAS